MTHISWHESSGEVDIPGKGSFRQQYAPGAFVSTVGKRVPFRATPGGTQIGWATVTSVVVDEDGMGATWTVDVDLEEVGLDALRDLAGFSFGRIDDGVPRDPLAAEPLVIRDRKF